jgi:hypothetical protein
MKHTDLEDGHELVTRTELREVLVSIHEEILSIHEEILSLRTELRTEVLGLKESILKLRNSLWLNVAVPSLTLIVSLVIHYIFR